MFAFQDTRGTVDVAFTDRHGGVSGAPYSSLNLAGSGTDDPDRVAENLERVARAFAGTSHAPGRPPVVVGMRQVHGADVDVIEDVIAAVSPTQSQPPRMADGLVTAAPGLVLMVRVADCIPLLLADEAAGVVGAAHAGRPGLVAGVVPATVARMRGLGAGELTAWMGPHVCGRCYEVPEQMRDAVSAVVPEAYAQTSWGTPAVDIGAGVRAQLGREGVRVLDVDRCTMEDEDLYSYRRQGAASGRFAGLVWVRP